MKRSLSLKKLFLCGFLLFCCIGALLITGLTLYLKPGLPEVETLKNIQLQTPLRIYSADHRLIAEFGEKRRQPIKFQDAPPLFIKAILAAEDDRFEKHHGVDLKGLLRAAVQLITTGHIQSGGSTITMQVAKNYFLSRERTFSRKFNEILLALQIEQELSKEEILELYINKIYLGNRAYGIQAAARVYYGKDINELGLDQLAMIAGLPKAPSSYNPLANPERALSRRNWILQRMLKLNYIDQVSYDKAVSLPVSAVHHQLKPELDAPYVAEMVRAELLNHFAAEEIYTSGISVYTTLRSDLQTSANLALQKGLLAYDRRHGYRGPVSKADFRSDSHKEIAYKELSKRESIEPLIPALVTALQQQSFTARLKSGENVEVLWDGISWARPYINTNAMGPNPSKASDILTPGDQIFLIQSQEQKWSLAQLPLAQSAFVSLNPHNGAVLALVGGFNYHHSKFNRATQAARQPGSSFKPFLYTAALENGYTAASIINDAPVVFDDGQLENAWRPENYSGKFYGPTRLRQALYQSRNLVSVRLLRAITIPKAISYVERFGFPKSRLTRDLSLALGSATFTPLEIATGYASFANGGYKISPFFITRIEDNQGRLLFLESPIQACPTCESSSAPAPDNKAASDLVAEALPASETPPSEPSQPPATLARLSVPQIERRILPAERIIEARTAYIMNTILRDVVKRGTARRALSLGRQDLAGKTGTTNDQKDAWFSGFQQNIVATTWVGFDQPQTMGRRELGGYLALPVWIDFMREALRTMPEARLVQPEGLVTLRIDPVTGLRAAPGAQDAIFETFRIENAPQEAVSHSDLPPVFGEDDESIAEQLF